MEFPFNVFIFGSCVSRDAFELAKRDEFLISDYYARSSFASIGSEPFIDNEILSSIKSKWQKRMVQADMEKSVLKRIEDSDFDILLLDLIDERFNLAAIGSSVHTISTEYKKAVTEKKRYKFVKSDSEDKLRLWEQGLSKFANVLKKSNSDSKLVVNAVYWSSTCKEAKKLFENYSLEIIESTNQQLKWMYKKIEEAIPNAEFINYESDELTADECHKWGLSPFHYTSSTYEKTLVSLRKICSAKV